MAAPASVLVEGRLIAMSVSTLAAGPAFIFVHMLTTVPAPFHGIGGGRVVMTMILLSWPFAVLIGTIPLAVAVLTGAWLGRRWSRFRNPFVWAAVGLAVGRAMAPCMAVIMPGSAVAAVVTGGTAALIARRFVRWIDPIAPDASAT